MSLLFAGSFDEAGNTVTDYSGNGNSFSIASTGVTRTASGHTNGGVFDGSSTGASLPNIGQTSNRTVMAWIKTAASAPADHWPLIWNVVSLGSGSWGLLFLGGNATIQARNASGSAQAKTLWPTDGVFHHFAGTYDGTNIRMYLDGVLKQTTALAGPLRTDAAAPLLFGNNISTDVGDDLRLFDSAEDANMTTWMSTPVTAGSGPAANSTFVRQAIKRASLY